MTRESAISRATRHFDEGKFIADLTRRVAIRTESQRLLCRNAGPVHAMGAAFLRRLLATRAE